MMRRRLSQSSTRNLYTIPGLDDGFELRDFRDPWAASSWFMVVVPLLLPVARIMLFTFANGSLPGNVASVWLGIEITFTALFTTSDLGIFTILLGMVQKPYESLNARYWHVLYPSISISAIGHICLAVAGITLIPKIRVPFLYIAICLTVVIALYQILILRQCALIDAQDYSPLVTYQINGTNTIQERLPEPQQGTYHSQQFPSFNRSFYEPQTSLLGNQAPDVFHPLTSLSVAFQPRTGPTGEMYHNQNLDRKLEHEFGITILQQGFFLPEPTWESATAFGFSTLAVAVIFTRLFLLIALRNEFFNTFIYSVICVTVVELSIIIGFHLRAFARERPFSNLPRRMVTATPIWRNVLPPMFWLAIVSFNIVLFVKVDESSTREKNIEMPWGTMVKQRSDSVQALAAMCMTACMLEILLGVLYAASDFKWELPGD